MIDACVLVLNQYVTVECNQSIVMIKTRNIHVYLDLDAASANAKIG